MGPHRRHALGHRMFPVAHDQGKGPLRSMVAAIAGGIITHRFTGLVEIDIRPTLLRPATPAAKPDHLVVGGPFREGVVGRMHHHQPAAAAHKILKGLAGFGRPGGSASAEVAHHHGVVGEGGLEAGVFPLRGMRDDIDGKQAALLQIGLHHLRRLGPVAMVVLAVNDERPQRFGTVGGRQSKSATEHQRQRADQQKPSHRRKPPKKERSKRAGQTGRENDPRWSEQCLRPAGG